MSSEYGKVGSSLDTGCDVLLVFSRHCNLSYRESGGCRGDGGRYVVLECPFQGSPSGSYAMWCWSVLSKAAHQGPMLCGVGVSFPRQPIRVLCYVVLECPFQGSPSGSYVERVDIRFPPSQPPEQLLSLQVCARFVVSVQRRGGGGGGGGRNGGEGEECEWGREWEEWRVVRGMEGEGAEEWRERGQRNGGQRGMEGEGAEEWRERGQRNGGQRGMEGEEWGERRGRGKRGERERGWG